MIISYVVSILFIAALIMIVISTLLRKGKWGINFKQVFCPKCKTAVPKIRPPQSSSEALWGGWTCEKCSCKMNKWGVEIK